MINNRAKQTVSRANPAPSSARSPCLRTSFFKSVNTRVKSNRLGELLVLSGIIDFNQLDAALAEQQAAGGSLGAILLRQKSVTPVQLYRKLAEQWCIKASTAGLTLMMSAMTISVPTSQARAAQAEFQLASAQMTLPGMKSQQYPSLFGTAEHRSDNVAAFTKWTGMFARFEDQLETRASSPRIQSWKAELGRIKDKSQVEQIRAVNAMINDVRYIGDKKNWGKSDYWATPIEFFSKGGDCEDFAIAKYASLRALGFTNDQMRLVIVQDTVKNIPHAILVVYTDEGAFVLDNQDKQMKSASAVDRYRPIFSINKSSWWLHKTDIS